MLIQVKEFHGNEKPLQVPSDASILRLKEEISKVFQLPVHNQRLMYKGKTLANDKTLLDYNFEEGSKVNLFKVFEGASENQPPGFWSDLSTFLRGYYDGEDVNKIIEHMKKDMSANVDSLNLEDIEKIACEKLSLPKD
ncbi:ubiquitin-like protein 4A [Tetranychus urticae]|uniref:Ubiquitin-like domain-containing protein n=1 Tax=Tetranychus urticae TaxID=32264 RepID=T1KUY1_TETUR|nr:ubiquitin-like protein 4A [Tetranychus urticae]